MTKVAIPCERLVHLWDFSDGGHQARAWSNSSWIQDWFGQCGRRPPASPGQSNFKKDEQSKVTQNYAKVKERGISDFFYKGGWVRLFLASFLASSAAILNMRATLSVQLAPFTSASSHLHVAILIHRTTVIPSEFLTRWRGGAGTSQEFILDRRDCYQGLC